MDKSVNFEGMPCATTGRCSFCNADSKFPLALAPQERIGEERNVRVVVRE